MSVRYQSQVREVINRNIVISPALAQGFNVFLTGVYDGGVDFILYREIDGLLHNSSARLLDHQPEMYRRDIWIAFPIGSDGYLVPHDVMVAWAEAGGITKTASWIDGGLYSRPRPSAAVVAQCGPSSSSRQLPTSPLRRQR